MAASLFRRLYHLFVRGIRAAEFDVVLNRIGKQIHVLKYHADILHQAVQLKIPDIFAANRNSPGVYIPKPGNQVAHSRLARTGWADNSRGRSGRNRKADVIQNLAVCVAQTTFSVCSAAIHLVGKVHVIKYDFRGCRNHIRPLFIHDRRIVNRVCRIHRSRQHLQQGSHIPGVFQIIEHHK